ncbi:MAG: hypothetical protein OIF55_20885 [Amphritea sp.]|nr:hypothetical protein [Amphritea sp.]
MEDNSDFFERSNSKSALSNFKKLIEGVYESDEFSAQRNAHIHSVVQSMIKNPEQWGEYCSINVSWIGDHFISQLLINESDFSKEKFDDIFSICFRFLLEFDLSIKNELSREFEKIKQFAFRYIDDFEDQPRDQIEFAIKEMPISIFKSIANSDTIQSIKSFNEISQSLDERSEGWEKTLAQREARVESLKDSLKEYESGFNFVGLFDGFNDLAKEKKEEKDKVLFWIRVIGALIVLPLTVEIGFIYYHIEKINDLKVPLALSTIPTLSIVIILVYYFRVLLFNYKGVKSQILQIELRKTLCRFIQHYADYSSDIKKKDGSSLEKFESIIFSGIVSDDEKLPSTFDGMEQIGKLIKMSKS